MSEFLSENSELSDVAYASELLRTRVAPPAFGSVKSRISGAARRLKWTASRVKDIWYQDARLIKSHEMERLKAVARIANEEREKDETRVAALRLSFRLEMLDADFHGPEIARLRDLACRLGNINS